MSKVTTGKDIIWPRETWGDKKRPGALPLRVFLSRDRVDHGLRAIGEIASRRGANASKLKICRHSLLGVGGPAANAYSIATYIPLPGALLAMVEWLTLQ